MNKKNHRSFGHIRKLPSGRFQASFLDPKKIRHNAPNTFTVLKDANAWLSKMQSDIERGLWKPDLPSKLQLDTTPAMAFESYVASRITKRGQSLSTHTISHYRALLNGVLCEIGEIPFNKLDRELVNSWYSIRVRRGKITTASKGYKLLKAMCQWAIENKLIEKNPCDIKGAQTATSGKVVNVPTAEDVRNIATLMPDALGFSVILAAYAGLRFGELTELRRKDVIFSSQKGVERMQVSISRSVSWFDTEFHVGPPKSRASVRTIDVTTALIPEARKHLETFVGKSPDSLLFTDSKTAGHLRHDKYMRPWRKANLSAGIAGRKFSPHSLRHFGATNMVRSGATLPDLKMWLGDSSTEAVTRYLHATDHQKSLADRMEFVF